MEHARVTTDFFHGRHAGVLLPLFSAPSSRSWGIGEIADLIPLCSWLRRAGCNILQLLPVNEMSPGGHSPYSAISAMAIDPVFISAWAVDDVVALGGEATLDADGRERLARARSSSKVEYDDVRAVKERVFRAAFERFVDEEWSQESARAADLARFRSEQSWWLEEYALFRALRRRFENRAWWEWDQALAERQPAALAEARAASAEDVLYYQYLQWIANAQWQAARRRVAPVGLFGDLPFMVGRDSADVWARPHAFDHDATVGTPPDAFSPTGQDWGLPAYRWDVFAREGDAWIRERARRGADLFSGYRVDHVVGFYRTYVIPADGSPRYLSPPHQKQQRAQGERLMRAFAGPNARVIAEDLGTVPDFVRASLSKLGIPGYRVLRWEREWNEPGQPFRDPGGWPASSVATTGTHDTEALAEWWETASAEDRLSIAKVEPLARIGFDPSPTELTPTVRDSLLGLVYGSGSSILLLPIQDVFGWRDRINVPATVTDDNWTWRLPWLVDRLDQLPEAMERATALRNWAEQYRRLHV